MRKCLEGYKVGLFFVWDVVVVQDLLSVGGRSVVGEIIYFDVFDMQGKFVRYFKVLGFQCGFEIVWMYFGQFFEIDMLGVFVVMILEFG